MKKILFSFLMGSLVIGSFGGGIVRAGNASFSDVPYGNVYYDAVSSLKLQGIIHGYPDLTFKPDDNINRAEFLTIVMQANGEYVLPTPNAEVPKDCFKDVKSSEWYGENVCLAKALGLVDGYSDGTFKPGSSINFAEASKIIVNAAAYTMGEGGDTWFYPYVKVLEEKNAIPITVSTFDHLLTRGEMAEMIHRTVDEIEPKYSNDYEDIESGKALKAANGEMVAFDSCSDMTEYILENSYAPEIDYEKESTSEILSPSADNAVTISEEASSEDVSADHSETNVQVAGVDEADIVKTDGNYIYYVSSEKVRVVDAFPALSMKELSAVTFDEGFSPVEVYVDGNKLIVLGDFYNYDYYDYYGYSNRAEVYIFDITDKNDIKELRKVSIEGSYSNSRKIGDMVYLVSDRNLAYYPLIDDVEVTEEDLVPMYEDSASGETLPVTLCGDVFYMPQVMPESYLVVAGIPVDDVDGEILKEVALGASGTVYASTENLYVAEYDYGYWDFYGTESDDETNIHKFSLGADEINYEGKGSVPGQVDNQFSMDENDGYFRVTTTQGEIWDGSSTNNLYILDSDMKIVGQITGIAPGEEIYSTRFIGDRAYMVTFKKVDPLFVIDVSDPTNPEILGKLKIPGFSEYLHPYDENHIIGFGKEAVDASEAEVSARDLDFAWYQGLKIAMFDVTDVNNPVELHKEIIGDRGTSSPLLWDHKALLFDKEKGIMAFPVLLAELPEEVKADPDTDANTYGDYTYQGAYVYDVSLADGFQLRGRITHYDENEIAEKSGYYWSGVKDIDRILYIGDYFYTISEKIIRGSFMDDLTKAGEVEFSDVEDYSYDYDY